MAAPDLSVIIVSWNTVALLRNCLNSIYEQTRENTLEVIVVDNNSPDNSADMVAKEFPQVILIANPDNKGFAAANNQAMAIAKGGHLLLLNPDTVLVNHSIDQLMHYARVNKDRNLGVITCKLLNEDLTLQKSVNQFYSFWRSFVENRLFGEMLSRFNSQNGVFMSFWDHSTEKEIDWAYGAVMLFSREVFEKVGYLDDLFYIYAEEMDYFMRVKKAGFTSVFVPSIEIIHLGKSSSRQRRAAMFIQNYKSFYIFLLKHYSRLDYLAYRLRATVYLLGWYLRYSFSTSEEGRIQRQVYAETLKWHFSPHSHNLLPRGAATSS